MAMGPTKARLLPNTTSTTMSSPSATATPPMHGHAAIDLSQKISTLSAWRSRLGFQG
ncbi:hypothetical protein SNOG_00121 [Parastagonospora nodorum SN15]|uniref:Uncharacterized protein n=1 Tax=Phaeosphaeria nodorum (strain SN15 / ATCC MYA-4574 / FGSC 10173) TaxID=321614 RepID=Q0V793_PHANO|nr:hypothetical protein SNOG_00121 [Parastagonospora nodorum SN15]EAT91616.1 hypothetical protein SNOG_00121 [Parastagonospora nodorum SN15]